MPSIQIRNGTYFLSSRSFCQWGKFWFSKSRPRQIKGSPKKPNPITAVLIFMNRAEEMTSDTATIGTSRLANLRRGISLGKGGVGDKALY